MTQLDYLDSLKRALAGLPASLIAETLAEYEHRFIEGLAFGRTESDIAAELPDPVKVAAGIRATTDFAVFQQAKTVPNAFRFVSSGLGLLVVNFLLIIPVIVFSAMLLASFLASCAFYVGGITVAATGLANTDYVAGGPFKNLVLRVLDDSGQHGGMRIGPELPRRKIMITSESGVASSATASGSVPAQSAKVDGQIDAGSAGDGRIFRTLRGVGVMIGGILLFLLNLVIAKYAFIGMKRYVSMNLSVLRTA